GCFVLLVRTRQFRVLVDGGLSFQTPSNHDSQQPQQKVLRLQQRLLKLQSLVCRPALKPYLPPGFTNYGSIASLVALQFPAVIAEKPDYIRIYFRASAGDYSLPLSRPAVFDAPA